ncbi:MAG: SurA N-terminal domain-containing protein [Halothiobacillaceae bacterium]
MLLDIRDKIRGWIAYLIVGLISIPFVLWGVGEYFAGGKDEPVAVVDGREVTAREFDQAYAAQRQQIIQALGGSASADMLEQLNIRGQVLDRLIGQTVMAQYTREAGYRAPDDLLVEVIESIDAFKVDGQFNRDQYERLVQMQGMSVAGFEQQLRQDIASEQLNTAVLNTAVGVDPQIDQFVVLRDQTREVGMLRLARADFAESIEPVSEQEVAAYHEANQDRYFRPEQVVVEYIELTPELAAADVQIDPARLEMAYEEHVRRLEDQTLRSASHILVTLPADADPAERDAALQEIRDARARIEDGESFEAVAREVSDDPGSRDQGGSLGTVEPGVMVPAFEEALFALDSVGEISEPVRSEFGYHLIRLDGLEAPEIPGFEEMRAELEADVRRREAEGQFHDLAESLANLAYENPDSLLPASEVLGIEIRRSDRFSRDKGEGIADFSQLRATAFSTEVLEEGNNSDLVELGANRVVVLRVAERYPAEPLPLEEVADEIRQTLEDERIEAQMEELAESLAAQVEAGDLAEALPKGVERVDARWVGRQDEALPTAVTRRAFALGRPGEDGPLTDVIPLAGGDIAVAIVSGVREGDASQLSERERNELRRQMAQDAGLREVDALAAALRDMAEVEIRKDLQQNNAEID